MSQESVAFVRGGFEAFARGDLEWIARRTDPDCEIVEPPGMPDRMTYRGPEGVVEALAHWPSEFENFRAELVRLVDAGESVVSLARHSGRGKGSGVEVSTLIANVQTIRDGKLVRWEMFGSWEAALEAVGLEE